MKVRDFVKKYCMTSNADVFLENVSDREYVKLETDRLRNMEPETMMDMTVQSFKIIDNVLTIYARRRL